MGEPETFVCGHGRTIETGTRTPPPECEHDVRALLGAATGDEREAVLRSLLDDPLCVRFGVIHEVAEALVGRPVWTHEFASPDHLYAEARTGQHPADLEAHVIGSLDQLAGTKPVVIVRADG